MNEGSYTSTIAAIATGPAAGGIGVIRLSGPLALEAARRVAALPDHPEPRHAYFTRFADAGGNVLDEGLALYFPAPASVTGEDVVELHTHGSPRLLQLVLGRLLDERVRLAQPGEFTRRAFLNGRIDLARAEAVADLVAAESERAVQAAAAQLAGQLSARLEAIRAPLLALTAELEGVLSFPEEADDVDLHLPPRLDEGLTQLRALVATCDRGALLRRGARVVLYGPVNVGKSTLFNRLVGEARAIVDEEPGTTRDVLEARLELDGLAVTLVDTAGLRGSPGRVEALGISRTREAVESADVAVLLMSPEAAEAEVAGWRALAPSPALLEVHGKADLGRSTWNGLSVSGTTGAGLDRLRSAITGRLGSGLAAAVTVTSERHREALARALEAVERARQAADVSPLEVVAGELGLALAALAEITGENVSREVLDAVFQRFCIGK